MARPEHHPTPATRKIARDAARDGVSLRHIAAAIGIDLKTLRRHYGPDIAQARAGGVMAAAATVRRLARKGNLSAAMALLKRSDGWAQPPPPRPEPATIILRNYAALSDVELRQLCDLTARLQTTRPTESDLLLLPEGSHDD